MGRNQSALAEAQPQSGRRSPALPPPDATHFRAGGQSYYLHMGLADIVTLQRLWGFERTPGETADEMRKRNEVFWSRLDAGGTIEDLVEIVAVALTHCYTAQGKRPPRAADVLPLLDQLEAEPGEKQRATFLMLRALTTRFLLDCYGIELKPKDASEGKGPNAQSGEASIPSTS